MAYLPEPIELDELGLPLPPGDAVVSTPRSMYTPATAPAMRGPLSSSVTTRAPSRSFPRSTRRGRGLTKALAVLGVLGAAGVGVVMAVRNRHVPVRALAAASVDTSSMVVPLAMPEPAGGPLPPPRFLESSHKLGRGGALPATLRAAGLDNTHIACAIDALRPLVNMRALQPGDTVIAQRDPADNSLQRLEYRRSETAVWAVRFTPEQRCEGQRIEVVRTVERTVAAFKVDAPLAVILQRANLQPEIVPALQEAFAALDLGAELHRGDVVRLVVEEERLNGAFRKYTHVLALDFHGASGVARRGFWQPLGRHTGDFFDAEGFTRVRGPLQAPVESPRVTSPFDPQRMHPVLHKVMPHMGIDFGAPAGSPVYASADGVVIHVGPSGPAGNLVRLSHPALGVETGYAHLSKFAPNLQVGMAVTAHTLLGEVGSTGRSTGPHLHFSLKKAGAFVDPMSLYGAKRPVPVAQRAAFQARVLELSPMLDALVVDGRALAASPTAAPAVPGSPAAVFPGAQPASDAGNPEPLVIETGRDEILE